MKRFLTLLLLIVGCNVALAQVPEPQYVQGQILVQLNPYGQIESLIYENQVLRQELTGLEINSKVSDQMRVWLLDFDASIVDHDQMLAALKSNRNVSIAQFNHIIKHRATLPNDTGIGDQWQYVNTGQTGGLVGADLDADDAWDITTGGITAFGDTIVVCIIDDGIDFNHTDFDDNFWINHGEIPNDGIDNDNNGYTDDYRGWNPSNNDDNVSGGGHGTPVTGIIGAQGDNGNGVSGVNWDVKLMIVEGGGNEAQAIAAYSYPLAMRKMYNQSNGTEGAFVVSTNASWGIDGGQPANAPLWCAMYDTLGKYGVLNCGATANQNWNIDQVGDLPTACPSDYLIAVTNMTHNDVKETSAGYGATTIDIGAFGSNTYTTSAGGGYGGFGGTSGATPHVTGTIALMYSAPCPTFIAFAKAYPDSAALLAKQYIFDGGDVNAALQGITTTGKRLNMRGALDQLMNNCDTSTCAAPFGLAAINVIDTTATLDWLALSAASSFDLRYREVGTTIWFDISNATLPYDVTGLKACSNYEFQVKASCGTDSSSYSPLFAFQTDGCCEAPAGISTANEAATSADVLWNSVLAANTYNLRYREIGAANWTTMNAITGATQSLTGLNECSQYEVQLQTECDTGSTSYSASTLFYTLGCGACTDNIYCDAGSADASSEWIESVTIGTTTNTSGGDNGYGDYTGVPIPAMVGQIVDFTLEPGYSGQSWDEYFEIFIDYNHDGDFDDAGETAYDGGTVNAAVSSSFTVPVSATLGITRLRVVMRYNQAGGNCDPNFNFGEVEDYCLELLADSVGIGYEELQLVQVARVYPNPVADQLTVALYEQTNEQYTFELFDATGRIVLVNRLINGTSTIALSTLESGTYTYRIRGNAQVPQTGKLIVRH